MLSGEVAQVELESLLGVQSPRRRASYWVSRYHAEAAIAAEHAMAASFAVTRWQRIVACYEWLERLSPSPLHTLHRAAALAEWRGADAGLELLEGLAPPSWLTGSYLWSAVLADLYRRAGHAALAEQHRTIALASAPSPAVRAALTRRLLMDSRARSL